MTKEWYQTKKFLNLRRKWYEKLEKEGFYDIEGVNWGNGETHERLFGKGFKSAAEFRRQYNPFQERYWELARQRYWDMLEESYPSEDCEVWRLWTEGMTRAKICRVMGLSVKAVQAVLSEQESRMRDCSDDDYDDLADR